jgi:hypothetical protein
VNFTLPNLSSKVLKHQLQFMFAQKRFVALIGGLGCGKSFAIGLKLYHNAYLNQGFDGMLITRSGTQMEKLLIEVRKVFSMMGLDYITLEQFKAEAHGHTYTTYGTSRLIVCWSPGIYSTIYLSTTENNAFTRWAGGNMSFIVIDEIDTMPKAAEVWAFAHDRLRVGPFNQLACASTPEGYGFLWDYFENQIKRDPSLVIDREDIRGCSFDNPHVNKDWLKYQIQTRDPATMRAYIYGAFVNLEGKPVYYRFHKVHNITSKTLKDFPTTAICHIGVDFNKGINAAQLNFVQNGITYTVKEWNDSHDIDELIAKIRKELPGRPLAFYPDAAGFEGIRQLERAFGENSVHYHPASPRVYKRVHAVNTRFCTPTGIPTYYINPETCPQLHATFIRQVKDANGDPDKTKGLDHQGDGFGYFTWWHWPTDSSDNTVAVYAGDV